MTLRSRGAESGASGAAPTGATSAAAIAATARGTARRHTTPIVTRPSRRCLGGGRLDEGALELLGARLQVERPEVAPRHVDRDVEDRRRADAALERPGVGMSVEDEIRPMLDHRPGEPFVAEEGPDPLRLAVQRLERGRVVQQDDP